MASIVLPFLGHFVYINSVDYVIKKRKIPKFEFTNERLTYFMKFTIQHVFYVIKKLVSPKMFTNEKLFTIKAFTISRVHCMYFICITHLIKKIKLR